MNRTTKGFNSKKSPNETFHSEQQMVARRVVL